MAAVALFPPETGSLYYQLATGFLTEHRPSIDGQLTALIEPFYPIVLVAMRAVTGDHLPLVIVVQAAVAAMGGVLLYQFTLAKTSRARAAWTAALLYAFSPYLVRQAASFMEVTIAVVLLIALCHAAAPRVTAARGAAIGVLLGAIVLTRFSFAPIAIGAVLLLVRERVGSGIAAGTAAALVVAPWLACTASIEGSLLPPRIGENLFVSTSEWAEPVVPHTNVDVLVPIVDRQVAVALAAAGVVNPTSADRDRLLEQWTWRFVREHPLRALRLKLRNAGYALQPRLLPFTERRGEATLVDGRPVVPPQGRRPLAFEIAAALFQICLLAGAAAGLWKRRGHLRHDDALLLLVLLSVFAVAVAFFPTSRLLAPMTFVLMFYTAVGIESLIPDP